MRDSSRLQVYSAEDLSAENTVLVEPRAIAELQSITDRVVEGSWWTGIEGPRPVRVVLNRSERRSYYAFAGRSIKLSPRGCDLNTLCHELAHAAAGQQSAQPDHGPAFLAMHLGVRAALLGSKAAGDLAEVYGQFGLAIGPLVSVDDVPILDPCLYDSPHVVGRPAVPGSVMGKGPIAL